MNIAYVKFVQYVFLVYKSLTQFQEDSTNRATNQEPWLNNRRGEKMQNLRDEFIKILAY